MSPAPPAPTRPPVRPDPRILERRKEVIRSRGRQRLRALVAAMGAAALVGAGWGATRSPALDVDRVMVGGAARSGTARVVTASGIERGQAMVDVDEKAAARRVARLPWVQRATARREWPATVRIQVLERAAVAVTRDDAGGWALVDLSGRVLERAAEAPAGLAVLEGVAPAGPPGTRLDASAGGALAVAGASDGHLGARVFAVAATPEGLELRLRPEGTVSLGPPDDLADKLRAVRTVLTSVDPRTVATLDVRNPATPVLTRR